MESKISRDPIFRHLDANGFEVVPGVVAPATNAAASKATPVDADALPLVDSAASKKLKKLTWVNLKATLKTYFDTIYAQLAGSSSQAFSTAALTVAGLLDITNAAAGQVKFPSTQNASANANTLDDYKESTFTPGIAFGGGTTGITYTHQVGFYTKVGNLVHFQISILLSNKGSSTGAATVTGLPFTSLNTANRRSAFGLFFDAGATLTTNFLMAALEPNATVIDLYDLAVAAAVAIDDTDFTNTTKIVVAGFYMA